MRQAINIAHEYGERNAVYFYLECDMFDIHQDAFGQAPLGRFLVLSKSFLMSLCYYCHNFCIFSCGIHGFTHFKLKKYRVTTPKLSVSKITMHFSFYLN